MASASSPTDHDPSPQPLTLLSWNVAGISRIQGEASFHYKNAPGGAFAGLLQHLSADVIGLQEVKIVRDKLNAKDARIAGFQSFWSLNKKVGMNGVATFVREGRFSPVWASSTPFGDASLDDEGRCLVVDIGCACIFNVYVPNAGDKDDSGDPDSRPRLGLKLAFLRALSAAMLRIRRERNKPVVLMGDLNLAAGLNDVHPSRVVNAYHGYSREEIEWFQSILAPPREAERALQGELPGDCTPPVAPGSSSSSAPSASSEGVSSNSAAAASATDANLAAVGRPSPSRLDLVDVWRCKFPLETAQFSCWDWKKASRETTNEGARIDYILPDIEFCRLYMAPRSSAPDGTPRGSPSAQGGGPGGAPRGPNGDLNGMAPAAGRAGESSSVHMDAAATPSSSDGSILAGSSDGSSILAADAASAHVLSATGGAGDADTDAAGETFLAATIPESAAPSSGPITTDVARRPAVDFAQYQDPGRSAKASADTAGSSGSSSNGSSNKSSTGDSSSSRLEQQDTAVAPFSSSHSLPPCSACILRTPVRWSDHAAVVLRTAIAPPGRPPGHSPSPLSSAVRFKPMFGAAPAAGGVAKAGAAAPSKQAASSNTAATAPHSSLASAAAGMPAAAPGGIREWVSKAAAAGSGAGAADAPGAAGSHSGSAASATKVIILVDDDGGEKAGGDAGTSVELVGHATSAASSAGAAAAKRKR